MTPDPTGDGFTMYFSGNGNTNNVAGFEVRGVGMGYKMPYNNHFLKMYKGQIRFDNKNKDYVTYDDNYAFQGWSINKDATYQDTDKTDFTKCMVPNEALDSLSFLNYCLEHQPENVQRKDDNIIVTDYAVWDRVPLIDAADKYWYYSQVKDKTEDEVKAEVLKTALVLDKEDTNNEFVKANNSGLKVDVEGIDTAALGNLGEFGYVTVIIKVTDGAGNTAKKPIKLNITNAKSLNKDLDKTAGPLEDSYNTYIRFIDTENYNKTKTVDGKVVPDSESGALQENSIWYQDNAYKAAITTALGNMDGDSAVVTYEYDVHDIAASKHYCKVNGTGNFKGKNNLKNWYQKFIVDDGAKVAGTLPEAM